MSKVLYPGVMEFNFSDEISDNLIALTNKIQWIKASVYGKDKTIRKTHGINLKKYLPEINENVLNYINKNINFYCQYYGIDYLKNEGISFLKYSSGDFYKLHVDSTREKNRIFSIIIYLNPTEYSGGETYFKHIDLSIKPEKPSMLIFPSNYTYLHESKVVVDGTKYVLVDWYI